MPPRETSLVGAHVPTTGGLARGAFGYADKVGAEAVQVFVGNPRGWAASAGDPKQDSLFRDRCSELQVPAFVHAPYLINFGSPTVETSERSADALRHVLRRGAAIGARGVVVHTGSTVDSAGREVGLARTREGLLPLLDELEALEDAPALLLEPTAGQGQSLCSTMDELGPYLDALDGHPRLGVCLDTCHAFAAGHDLAQPGGVKKTLDRLVEVAGKGRLQLVHANDCKDVVGSSKDRHENIGAGHIGPDAFAELFRHPAVRGVPLVIETPGKADGEKHAADIALLKQLRDAG
ncbi:deoxyribonuclease IV [Motilibacter aurantiacus]|uniref:deoxyribonuclease IV n=1 Tax=Motilibacter aurantiacus TaxID=2714955 RepID=UPI00140E67F4|nr:deoxyribonuclease IV [Motilibacter aurantiacus]